MVHFWANFPEQLLYFRLAVMPGVVIRQRKPFRRKDGLFIYFEGER